MICLFSTFQSLHAMVFQCNNFSCLKRTCYQFVLEAANQKRFLKKLFWNFKKFQKNIWDRVKESIFENLLGDAPCCIYKIKFLMPSFLDFYGICFKSVKKTAAEISQFFLNTLRRLPLLTNYQFNKIKWNKQ